jgi:hypothetical protein
MYNQDLNINKKHAINIDILNFKIYKDDFLVLLIYIKIVNLFKDSY